MTHHPIDLLPDREAETLTDWLASHPELTHVTRDRYPRFQAVISTHASNVIQIHDRFHLIQNLWSLHDQIIRKIFPARVDLGTHLPRPDPPLRTQSKANIRQAENARNKWEQAQILQKYYANGYSTTRISKQFNLHWKTVKRYLEMTARRTSPDRNDPILWMPTTHRSLSGKLRDIPFMRNSKASAIQAHMARSKALLQSCGRKSSESAIGH